MAKIRFTAFNYDGLTIYEGIGLQGDYFDIVTDVDTHEPDVLPRTLFVDGQISLHCVNGVDGPHASGIRLPGDCTLDPQPYTHRLSGTIRMQVDSAGARYYCMWRADRQPMTGQSLSPAAGDTFTVPTGHWLFVGKGTIETTVNDSPVEFTAPALLEVATQDTTFIAVTAALLAQIAKS